MRKIAAAVVAVIAVPAFGILSLADPPEADARPICGCWLPVEACIFAIPAQVPLGVDVAEAASKCFEKADGCLEKCADKKACKEDCKKAKDREVAMCETAFAESKCAQSDDACRRNAKRDLRTCKQEARRERRACKKLCD